MQTIAWRQVAGTVVLVHGATEPADHEWTEYLGDLRRFLEVRSRLHVLVVTPGPAPNMRQRKLLNDVFQGRSSPTAVVTDSTVGRAVVTLLGLRNPDIRAFDPGRLDEAFKYLEVPGDAQQGMKSIVSELRRQVGLAEIA